MRAAARISSSVAPGLLNAMFSRIVPVEQKVVLHDDADVRSIVAQPDVRDVMSVDQHASALWVVERHHQADERALAAAARADERRRRSGLGA